MAIEVNCYVVGSRLQTADGVPKYSTFASLLQSLEKITFGNSDSGLRKKLGGKYGVKWSVI